MIAICTDVGKPHFRSVACISRFHPGCARVMTHASSRFCGGPVSIKEQPAIKAIKRNFLMETSNPTLACGNVKHDLPRFQLKFSAPACSVPPCNKGRRAVGRRIPNMRRLSQSFESLPFSRSFRESILIPIAQFAKLTGCAKRNCGVKSAAKPRQSAEPKHRLKGR